MDRESPTQATSSLVNPDAPSYAEAASVPPKGETAALNAEPEKSDDAASETGLWEDEDEGHVWPDMKVKGETGVLGDGLGRALELDDPPKRYRLEVGWVACCC